MDIKQIKMFQIAKTAVVKTNHIRDSACLDFLNLSNHTSGLASIPSNLDISEFLNSDKIATLKNPLQEYNTMDLEYYLKNELKLGNRLQKEYN
jgi:hypothetical protein